MRWQVCIEDAATGILLARVHRGMKMTMYFAIRRQNELNALLWSNGWRSVRAVIVPARHTDHLRIWRITSQTIPNHKRGIQS